VSAYKSPRLPPSKLTQSILYSWQMPTQSTTLRDDQ
jgi:hypothetical protein